MYTKVFRSIYDGTLADNWKAMVTFQQLLILADADGVVDMTIGAIARTTGIPPEILNEGIAYLEQPDPQSRTPDMQGRRIAKIDQHRGWGWFLVNFKKYKEMRTREEKRDADRERMRQKRQHATDSDMSQSVAACSEVSPMSPTHTHTNTEESKALVPADAATPPKVDKSERLATVTRDAVAAYNDALAKPRGLLAAVTLPDSDTRRANVKRCLKIATLICQDQFGDSKITPEFWRLYFGSVKCDPFLSGAGPYSGSHANWRPDFEFLTRPETVEKVFDKAVSA